MFFSHSRTASSVINRGSGENSNSPPARMKKTQIKVKALKWKQHDSHYWSMGFFPDNQGQLTPQSVDPADPISNSCAMFWRTRI